MFSRIILVCVLLAASAAVAGCGARETDSSRLEVVAGFYPLAYAAEQVGGDAVRVTSLTPAGAEPHGYELRPGDTRRIAEADLVVYLGGGFQPALEEAIAAAEGVTALDLGDPGRGESAGPASHPWLDPLWLAASAERVSAALGGGARGAALAARARRLDVHFSHALRACARREIVVSHAAFGAWERYGLRQLPVTGGEPEAEPGPRDIERLVEDVRRSGATTVFFEPLVSPRLTETVAREADVRTALLNPIEGLTSDELERGEDYFTVMRLNLAALREALGCR
jgi:zinc transport system substrate-binding protein